MPSGIDIFEQINNAVLDLQASDYQTFERPLKALNRLLHHPDLEPFNRALTDGIDFDAFMAASEATQGGMMGSAQLQFPEDREKEFGLILILIDRMAGNPDYAVGVGHQFFNSGTKIVVGIHSMNRQLIMPFVRDYKAYILSRGNAVPRLIMPRSNKVFVVHGHDGEARESVARYLGNIGFQPIILHEQANKGRTVIEKVEADSDVGFAVVLLTPDDEGRAKGGDLEPRARQNVLLELGYFLGKLGRSHVCALKRGEVEIPSDFAGVVWETMDAGGGWKQRLGKELEAAGYNIDWNRVMKS